MKCGKEDLQYWINYARNYKQKYYKQKYYKAQICMLVKISKSEMLIEIFEKAIFNYAFFFFQKMTKYGAIFLHSVQ